jgi:hypothetical protein
MINMKNVKTTTANNAMTMPTMTETLKQDANVRASHRPIAKAPAKSPGHRGGGGRGG